MRSQRASKEQQKNSRGIT